MNYGDLLFKAHENKCSDAQKEVRCYKTSFSAPKKLTKSTVSSDNIKKFLQRREEEEKKRLLEAQQKRTELLALRSQDKKAQKRVQVMLKRTKSANKSVMEDAIDHVNTADTLNGPNQCDDDDYGYVSQEASAFYNKLINKYESMPPEPSIFSKKKKEVKDLAAAKDRVKIALQKEAEEAEQPHKRKRKSKTDAMNDFINDNDEYEQFESNDSKTISENNKLGEKKKDISSKEKEIKQKIKKTTSSAPPPPDFNELLKIAREKQHEPIMINLNSKQNEPKRLMTSKEKAEFEKEEERKKNRLKRERDRALGINPDKPQKEGNTKGGQTTAAGSGLSFKKIPKLSDRNKEKPNENAEDEKQSNNKKIIENKPKTTSQEIQNVKKIQNNDVTTPKYIPTKITNGADTSKTINRKLLNGMENKSNISNKQNDILAKKSPQYKSSNNVTNNIPQYVPKPKVSMKNVNDELSSIDKEIELLRKKKLLLAIKAQENNSTSVPKYVPTAINKPPPPPPPPQPQQKLSKDMQSRIREEIRPIKKKTPAFKKRVIESDSEYDSELDDFIDDGPEGGEDYSKVISEIFGYDKSKYRDVEDEDEDECMESNFAQQMREEFVSTRIGIMEDLEDIRKEQEEKKLKAKKKMRRL